MVRLVYMSSVSQRFTAPILPALFEQVPPKNAMLVARERFSQMANLLPTERLCTSGQWTFRRSSFRQTGPNSPSRDGRCDPLEDQPSDRTS
jgi:hypothetical protein